MLKLLSEPHTEFDGERSVVHDAIMKDFGGKISKECIDGMFSAVQCNTHRKLLINPCNDRA